MKFNTKNNNPPKNKLQIKEIQMLTSKFFEHSFSRNLYLCHIQYNIYCIGEFKKKSKKFLICPFDL